MIAGPAGGPCWQHREEMLMARYCTTTAETELWAWNNGKEVPRWGVAEIQKMSPSTTGRCSRHAAAVLSNKGVP